MFDLLLNVFFGNGCGRNLEVKPVFQRDIKAYPVHVIEKGFAQTFRKKPMIHSHRICKIQFVVGKRSHAQVGSLHPKCLGIQAYRAVCSHGKTVPKTGLEHARLKQLPDHFHGVDRLLSCLRGIAIHQVGMDHDSRLGKMIRHLGHLSHGYALFDQGQKAVRGYFQTSRHRNTSRSPKQATEISRKAAFKADIRPPHDH